MTISAITPQFLGTMACEPHGQVQIVEFTCTLSAAATHPLQPLLDTIGAGAGGSVVQLFDGGGVTLASGGVGLLTCLDFANQNLQFLLGSTGATGSASGVTTGMQLIAWISN